MTDEQNNGPPEGLLRMAEYYAGTRDLAALEQTQVWRETNARMLENFENDEDAAFDATVQVLSEKKTTGATVHAFFFANVQSYNRKERKKEPAMLCILAGGRTKTIPGEFDGRPLQPVDITEMQITENIYEGLTEYRIDRKKTKVVPSDHQEPVPEISGFGRLNQICRKQSKASPLIVGEIDDALVAGIVLNEQGRGIFVNEDEEHFKYGVEFSARSADGGEARLHLSPKGFQERFRFNPFDDIEQTKKVLAGQDFIALGRHSVLTKLPDEVEKHAKAELEAIARDKTGPKGGKGKSASKIVLKQPDEVTAANGAIIPIVGGYETEGSFVFQTDCAALGYLPEFTCEPVEFPTWTKAENATIVFPHVQPGRMPVQSKFRGLRQHFQATA